jgi:type I restriction enzyme M protein
MVNLIFTEDDDVLSRPGTVRSLYEPTAGTGGMLSIAEEYPVNETYSRNCVVVSQPALTIAGVMNLVQMSRSERDFLSSIGFETVSDLPYDKAFLKG